ncbi:MAG: S8 family peptidase [Bacteroidota bacterium]|nr:S8 family peptidase [Bacteroidota bacterium]
MKCLLIAALTLLVGLPPHGYAQNNSSPVGIDYHLPDDVDVVPGTVIVKFRSAVEHRLTRHAPGLPSLTPVLARYGVENMMQMYPRHNSVWLHDGSELALQRMYRVEFHAPADPRDVAAAFAALPEVEYAEPEVVQRLLYRPDDPRLSDQYALLRVEAEKAWDISRGSAEVVIAIVDSGVLLTHEDLKDNLWINPGEDIDGDGVYTAADIDSIDSDGNGYVDDIIGIDFVGPSLVMGGTYYDNDPDPTRLGHPHGTHVAGIAAGVGDNGKGIAGLAYQCRIMAIKCGSDRYAPSILRGYDGIVYAADNGADVINCSWGGGGYLQSQKERIDYAISRGAIVVAAAGNTGSEGITTPGAYPNVLSVSNTNSADRISGSSTYGSWVDVAAPGTDILSCVINNDGAYQNFTGTSMASPYVAGLAALVKSHRPALTPEQIFEQIRVTTDPVDALQNRRYHRKIGSGRINAFRALTESSPALRLVDWSFSDATYGNGDGIPDQGEMLEIVMRWQNLLDATQNAVITLTTGNARVQITDSVFVAGSVPTFGEVTNATQPFLLRIEDSYAPNNQVDLFFTIEDGEYTDYGAVFFIQQPTYRDHDINDIRVTVTNDGNIGFDDLSGVTGSGLRYKGRENVLFEGAMILGAEVNKTPLVVDVARTGSGSQMDDFSGEGLFHIRTPGIIAEQEGMGKFGDGNAPLSHRLQTEVTLHSFAFTRPEAANMVFLRYTIHNNSGNTHENFHAGLFFDWDVGRNSQTDIALFNDSLKLAMTYDSTGYPRVPVAVGCVLLTPALGTAYWGINNRDNDDDMRIGIYNGFSKEEKWKALSSGIVQPVAGITDVSQVISAGPVDLAPGDSLVVGFALIAADSPREVMASVPHSLALWDTINRRFDPTDIAGPRPLPGKLQLHAIAPHPVRTSHSAVTVDFSSATSGRLRAAIYDLRGRRVTTLFDQWVAMGRQQFRVFLPSMAAGVYVIELHGFGGTERRVFQLLP